MSEFSILLGVKYPIMRVKLCAGLRRGAIQMWHELDWIYRKIKKMLPFLHVGKIVRQSSVLRKRLFVDHLSFSQINEVDQKHYKRNEKPAKKSKKFLRKNGCSPKKRKK